MTTTTSQPANSAGPGHLTGPVGPLPARTAPTLSAPRTALAIFAGVLVALLGTWLAGAWGERAADPDAPAVHVLGGVHYNPPRPAPDIAALNHHGQQYTLSKQPHPLFVIFFGYVSCLDVCPTNLKRYEKMQELLGSKLDQVQFVFVSIDPAHETPEVMKEYLSHFRGEIIGVTGTPEELEPVYDAWGILREKIPIAEPIGGRDYKFDHTGQIFLVQGRNLRVSYPYGTPHDEMARDIEALLRDPSLGERLPEIGELKRITLPPGAYSLAFQKKPTIPTYIRLRVGDTLVWKNDDYMYHFVGDLRLAPGDEASQTFTRPGEFYLGCTATPEDKIRIVILDD